MSTKNNYMALIAKGVAMGAADVVPGVSGGTIAFITGIYDRLINALRSVKPSLLRVLKNDGIKGVWQAVDGTFLACVFGGVLTSILVFAHIITYFMVNYPQLLWSFFFGLILVSGLQMIKEVASWNLKTVSMMLVGIAIAYTVGVLKPMALEPTLLTLFFAGSIAICAMILPGISGSFILLMMGLYPAVMDAVKSLDVMVLAVFGTGCVSGLLAFSHLLSWLLTRHRDMAISLLTGLMLGALGKVWPWKQTLTTRINSSGEEEPLLQANILPGAFEQLTGQPSQMIGCVTLMAIAIALVLLLEWRGKRATKMHK